MRLTLTIENRRELGQRVISRVKLIEPRDRIEIGRRRRRQRKRM